MAIRLISCGIFKAELEKILPEVEKELGVTVSVDFLKPALDVDERKLETALRERLESAQTLQDQGTILLYGSMCHPEMARIAGQTSVPAEHNCVELLLGPEKKKAMDQQGNFYYMSVSALNIWREIYLQGHGWEAADARMNFGSFEKIIVLDTGTQEITDEALFDFFEYAQVPVEPMPIDLEYFTAAVLDLCRKQVRLGAV
jgi:hypothetical protein